MLRSHPYRTAGAATVVLAALAWVAFGFFGIHTLFVDDVVSEAAPVFDAPNTPVAEATSVTAAPPEQSVGEPVEPPAEPADPATPTTTAPVADRVSSTPAEPAGTTGEIVTELTGTFVGDAHPTAGRAVVLGNGTGQRFLRFEDFETDNGPDLNVYLVNSATGDVSDYVDLGDLKGNVGEQNYEIPAGVDLAVYDSVVIWCVRFGVGFGNAALMPA